MKREVKICLGLLALPLAGVADNPIVQTYYTADPAPMVYNGRFYIYTGHDEDVTVNNYYTMNDWKVYSSADMVNWTDHGTPLSSKDFSWAKGDAWAAQAVERDGKFYYYVPLTATGGGFAIGVGVSDSPTGPFKDALGKPLLSAAYDRIDPTVFIDDDGQAYMYLGWTNTYYVKLNKDMISTSGNVTKVTPSNYVEGPWLYKRKGTYFLVYPSGSPEAIAYSTSTSPTGPWTYKGVIMAAAGASFTNQAGIVDFAGKSYFVYHNGALPGGGGYKRSAAVEEFTYNADGTIPTIKMTSLGPSPVVNLDPYVRQEGETMAFSSGLKTKQDATTGVYVTSIHSGDYIKLRSVDFTTAGAKSFLASVGAAASGGSVEMRLDSKTGTVIGTLSVPATGGATTWKDATTSVAGATGVHDLFLLFKGSGTGELFNLDFWKFTSSAAGVLAQGGKVAKDLVDVYSVDGAKLRANVSREDALRGLGRGVYFRGGEKVFVAGE